MCTQVLEGHSDGVTSVRVIESKGIIRCSNNVIRFCFHVLFVCLLMRL